jgi:hypothetical protein
MSPQTENFIVFLLDELAGLPGEQWHAYRKSMSDLMTSRDDLEDIAAWGNRDSKTDARIRLLAKTARYKRRDADVVASIQRYNGNTDFGRF